MRPEPPRRWAADGGPTNRAVVRILLIIIGMGGLLWLAWVSRGVLTWLAIGAFLAIAIDPLVSVLQRRLHLPRSAAIALVYLMGIGALSGAVLLFVPPLIDAGQQLADQIPSYVRRLQESELVQRLDAEYDLLGRLQDEATGTLEGVAGPDTAVEITQRIVNGLVAMLSIAVIAFLLSLYGGRVRRWVLDQTQGETRLRLERIADRIYRVIAGYVVGVALVAATGGLAAYIFLSVLGVPFAPLLAFWAGLASLIPMVGATLGGIPYITVAFFQGWPIGVAAIVFLIVYQQVENNLFQPIIHRFTVNLNPLWVILSVLVGSQVLGLVGALVAIPLGGIVQVLIQEWWSWRRGEPVHPVPPVGVPEDVAQESG
ncbi:MAG TPA: AI-2E family transporter [Miltoncostaeaceae bacterium]|nr:AI-2E family transporter [Miltoncostaeaceae bacterium]